MAVLETQNLLLYGSLHREPEDVKVRVSKAAVTHTPGVGLESVLVTPLQLGWFSEAKVVPFQFFTFLRRSSFFSAASVLSWR